MSRNLPPLLLALAVPLMQAGPAATDPAPGVVTITITGLQPVATTDSTAAAPAAGARISASYTHTCGVTDAGRAKCWCHNFSGELGDGTTDPHKVPRAVSGLTSGVAAIETGWSHTCALTDAGGVMCWGENYYGQLGDRTGIDHHTPVSVGGLTSGVTAITAGGSHNCALTEAGGAMCWGANHYGQLGNGTKKRGASPPDFVSGLASGVAAVAARGAHTCALTTAGAVKCWGSNRYGQLATGPRKRVSPRSP